MVTTTWTQEAGMTSETEADNVSEFADQASASATAAAASAAEAATSETNAGTSETNASTSATSASTSATAAATSATSASTSATAAATSASAASTSETNAATSESNASTSETNAATSATAASTAQTAAEAAQAAAEAAQEAIDGLYLGAQASNPTVDLNGDPVTAGDWYFNTVSGGTRVYDGSAWNSIDPDLSGDSTPQLGGDLDLNSNDITGTGNINITGNVSLTGTVDGRDVAADGTKLDGIESGATADQTKADIDALGIAASTAATLATARDISLTGDVSGSVSFDGSANVSITAVVADDSHNHIIANVDGLQTALDAKVETLADLSVTATAAELNALDGITATVTELNYNDITTLGTSEASKVVTADASGDITLANSIVENVYALSGTTPALDPNNGTVQTHTLTAATTYSDSFSAGQSMTLMIDDGTAYAVTWPTITWVNNAGSAPTLATSGYTVIALWKVSTTLYGALVGDGT